MSVILDVSCDRVSQVKRESASRCSDSSLLSSMSDDLLGQDSCHSVLAVKMGKMLYGCGTGQGIAELRKL